MATVQRRLSVIVAADVVGYSRLMGEDELGTLIALKAHREAIDPLFAEDGGRIVKTTGDGILLEFPSAFHAVNAALGVQRLMAERNARVRPNRRLVFRMGIHLGDVIVDDDDIFGDGVNIAARLQEIAEPGGICLSAPVHGTIHKNIEARFRDGGNKALKNIAVPVHVFNLVLDDAPAAAAPAQPPPAPALPLITAVVLPFSNMSGDARQDHFVDGVTELLTAELGHIESSFIVARDTAFAYRGDALEPAEIGRELGVRFVVKGSVRIFEARLRVNVQLIDAEDGRHLWVDRFDLTTGGPVTTQHDIVTHILLPLRAQLLAATGRRHPVLAAAPPRPAAPPASARPAHSPVVTVHPRSAAAPPAERRAAVPPPPAPARAPARAAPPPPAPSPRMFPPPQTVPPEVPPPAAVHPPARTVMVPVPPLADPGPAAAQRPWLWGVSLAIAAVAAAIAVVLLVLGIERRLAIAAAAWVLVVAGAVQMVSVLASGRRRRAG